MNKYILFSISLVLVSSWAQILLKVAANENYANKINFIVNTKVIGAYAILFLITFINSFFIFKHIDLSVISIIESLAYIFVPLSSICFLGEKISKKSIVGILFVLVGCVIFIFS